MNLSNNTILITGGASGIGIELVKQLHANNTIIITGRSAAKLAEAKKQYPKIHTIQSDVSKPQEITNLFDKVTKEFPDLNILINNAGIMRSIIMHQTTEDLTSLTQEIETNFSGPVRMVKTFLPHLQKKKTAAIVNVSSGLAYVPLPVAPVYSATKAALHSFTLSLRAQLKNTNVKVFELAPPATQTELLGPFVDKESKGFSIMPVDKMVEVAVAGFKNDTYEIRPGQSNQLHYLNRFAPKFIMKQMSKPLDAILSKSKH